jgi:hypothetical protein
MDTTRLALTAVPAALLLATSAVPTQAATVVTFTYTQSFGAVAPDGPAPYATATFDDGGVEGAVTLTMQVAPTVGEADVTQMYFNLDPSLDPTLLSFTRDSGTGPSAANTDILTGVDAFRAGGGGFYDILFDFAPPPGRNSLRFNAGESLTYMITGSGITADSFSVFETPGPGRGNPGPFHSVAKFQSTGFNQSGGDWVGATPVPAAFWLFGSGLLGMIGFARRKKAA